mgnify:CR=1 FL=1
MFADLITGYTYTEDWELGNHKLIYHMEMDSDGSGAVLFCTGNAIFRATAPDTFEVIAGEAGEYGYIEGNVKEARFNVIAGFKQVSGNRILVADSKNHCIRSIDRQKGTVSHVAGQCRYPGQSDLETGGQLSEPLDVIEDIKVKGQLLVTEGGNYKMSIRTVSSTGALGTFVKNGMRAIGQLRQVKSGDIYGTAWGGVLKIDYSTKEISVLVGSKSMGSKDGTLLTAQLTRVNGFAFVNAEDENSFLITDLWNRQVKVVDVKADNVTTLFSGGGNMMSVLMTKEGALLYGAEGIITQRK